MCACVRVCERKREQERERERERERVRERESERERVRERGSGVEFLVLEFRSITSTDLHLADSYVLSFAFFKS